MKIINRSLSGKMNLDADEYKIPSADYSYALNISRNNKLIPYSILGNELVVNPYLSGSGVNKRIGSLEDKYKNRIYQFVWNSNGYHLICYYDAKSNSFVKLIINKTDTGGVDVLNFNPSYRINHIDIIYRDEGDLLFWTDGYNAPRKLNVDRIVSGIYGVIDEQCIEAGKRPPLTPAICSYSNDTTRITNTLRKLLFQFKYRFIYDDFETSTWSPVSELPLPSGSDSADPTVNNFISLIVETGHKSVSKIEIAGRQLDGGVFGDFYSIVVLDKSDFSIGNETTYQFKFYNDTKYINIDINESLLIYDYFPLKADTQCLPNGNVVSYAAITEGYDNLNVSDLSVEITSELVTNTGSDGGNLSITYTESPITPTTSNYTINVVGVPVTGTVIQIFIKQPSFFATQLVASYTVLPGDDLHDIAAALYLSAISNGFPATPPSPTGTSFVIQAEKLSNVTSNIIIPTGSPTTPSSWNWNSKYRLGLVYVDEHGRTNGVTSFVNPTVDDFDFEVETEGFALTGSTPKTPVINASINHLPPSWATKYYWVRTSNLAFDSFLYYVTAKFDQDADFYYFCLANVAKWYEKNSNFVYTKATVVQGSRIKIIAKVDSSGYMGTIWTDQDYEVVGTETRSISGTDYEFVKIKKPSIVPSPTFIDNMLVNLYVPAKNAYSETSLPYFEFGQAYDIYELSGVKYHKGQIQNQTGSQPATFQFTNGDIYYRSRNYYLDLPTLSIGGSLLMDANFSDSFSSKVNSDGRGFIIDPNAKQQFFPTLIRFSGEYQQGTNINDTNRFYPLNYDEYDRGAGIIRKLFVEGRRLFVFQQFDVGVVPILTQIVKDTQGNPLEANSDILLNKITYPYIGKHGIGDVPESFAYSEGAKYYLDSNKGTAMRLSRDGQTEISVVYECNQFFVDISKAFGKGLDNGIVPVGEVYKGDPTVYGTFDNANNYYILNFEEIKRYSNPTTLIFSQDATSLKFFETQSPMQGFESFLSYHSEGMTVLNNLLVSYKDGNLWKHTSVIRNNFYGVQYESVITCVFNDAPNIKKTFETVAYEANTYWQSPTIGDIQTSQPNPQTGLPQVSQLKIIDYSVEEGGYYAAFWNDANSLADPQEALVNGDYLKGFWIKVKFRYIGNEEVFITIPHVGFNVSPKNS